MTLRHKIYLTVAVAVLVGGLFGYYSNQAREQTTVGLTLMSELNRLDRLQQELDGEILHGGFFLYHDYDAAHRLLADSRQTLARARELYDAVTSRGSAVPGLLADYDANLDAKEERIIRFFTANSVLKNSALYVPGLSRRIMMEYPELSHRYHRLLTDLTSALYLARSSLDPDLLATITEPLAGLNAYQPAGLPNEQLHQALLAHGQVFTATLPEYTRLLDAILRSPGAAILGRLQTALQEENRRWLGRINRLAYTFFAGFLLSVGLIIVLLIKTERENQKVKKVGHELRRAAATDRLTGLPNRFAFDQDQAGNRKPLLLLINIDDFKHINDLYGVQAGDHVLQSIAGLLPGLLPAGSGGRCYRLGGDDFGLLVDDERETVAAANLAQRVLAALERAGISYRDQPLRVGASIGISRRRPLLETADMALKEVKRQRQGNFLEYVEELNLQQRIADNLQVLEMVRRALARDQIWPHYQPIVDNRSGETVKYEALVRLEQDDGSLVAPGVFLEVVKGSSLYPEITRRVVAKSFAAFAGCRYGFSLNLSIADILDEEVMEFIMGQIRANPDTARRLTFEILESEGVENVEPVQRFIEQVKEAGCQIAIDDFGSGYSNFAHILQFKVDSIKIDASLIRDIHQDTQARVLVYTIVDFCRQLGIRTVAEFVHSEEVHRVVKELGIDYSQGYYLGKPGSLPNRDGHAERGQI